MAALSVGFIGLGDQGLPMATAIAAAGHDLHVWARHAASLEALGETTYHAHEDPASMAAACSIVGLCVATDDGVLSLAEEHLLGAMADGSVLVNHGTGTPANARRLTELGRAEGVDVLDAPVSGGRPAAEQRRLTTLVGGEDAVVERCRPVLDTFSEHVVHLGPAGTGQIAKLVNNALLMMNQASIAEVVDVAIALGTDPVRLLDALKLGSANSEAMTLLNTMVTPETVDHLATVEAEDMDLFAGAMDDAGVDADPVTRRGQTGARRLPELIGRLNA